MRVVLSAWRRGMVARLKGRRSAPAGLLVAALALSAPIGSFVGAPASAWGSSLCPNEALRNGSSAHLPDCRAYELVSPADKNGGGVDGGVQLESVPPPEQSSTNGEIVTFAAQTAFTSANPKVALAANQYISKRGPNGWSTEAISPSQIFPGGELDKSSDAIDESLYRGFPENLATGFLLSEEPPLVPQAPRNYYNPYLRNTASGGFELLSAVAPPVAAPGPEDCCQEPQGFMVTFAGISADSKHAVFAANDAIVPGAIPGAENLYQWNEGQVELVSTLPGGEAVAGATFGGYNESGEQGSENYKDFYRAISTNGKRSFWTGPAGGIYMHELTPQGARTVQVGSGKYWASSNDGSVLYYGQAGAWHPGGDLYRYDVATGHATDIAPGVDLSGVLGASDDGSYVYFAGRGAIASGATEEKNNIYVWHSTGPESGTVTFIAALTDENIDRENWYEGLPERTSRVSPSGQYVAFQSVTSLTGYDNKPLDAEESCPANGTRALANFNNSGRCSEVYEYNAAARQLTCVSCNPGNFPPIGDSAVPGGINFLQAGRGWQSNTDQQRYLDDSGRLFFNSYEALVPQATNNNENVYEFDPNGVGSCARAAGCVSLISTGTGAGSSEFLDASADGNDVFFVTFDQLVPQDGDALEDLYDARVGGGFSLPSAPPCSGEACKPPNAPAPSIYGAPASAAFVGPGNPSATSTSSQRTRKTTIKRTKAKKKKKKARAMRTKHAKTGKKGKR